MSVTDEIKARLDIVSYIIDSGVNLKKAGRSFKAICPFHQERTPSFVVFPESQTWRCFGACNEGGDVFNFAMKLHGWDFSEALRNLADLAGVELKPRTPEQTAQDAAFDRLLGLLNETAAFFHQQLLTSPAAQPVRDYVARRSLNDDTIEQFLLGYAPESWNAALNHLKTLGYNEAEIVEAGVAIRNERGRVYDRFRHRLVIPIRDSRDRVIGFGARALRDEDQPKYLNSPQSELFDKSRTLYGLSQARRDIRETETAVIVEGYMDVMQAHQAGFRNVVAQMGTALTEPQLRTLSKYASRIVLALDADQAGINATMRGLDVARTALNEGDTALLGRDGSMRRAVRLGIDMRVLIVTEGKDPDDLIRQNPAEWQRLIDEAEPVADFVIRMGTAGLDPRKATSFEKEAAARRLLPLLTATENDLHKEANVQKLALALHLPERRLMEIARESRASAEPARPTNPRFREQQRTQTMDRAATRPKAPRPPEPRPSKSPPPQSAPSESVQPDEPPPLDYNALAPPPDDDFDDAGPPDESYSAPLTPAERPRPQPQPVRAQEQYCLGMLLGKPALLYQANRALRTVAQEAAKACDESSRAAVEAALGPLNAADFMDAGHQVIFQAITAGLAQDEVEPLVYAQQYVDDALRQYIAAIMIAPLDAHQEKLPASLRVEIESILKQQRKNGRLAAESGTDIVEKVLELRRDRLRRANEEVYFLLQDVHLHGESADPAAPDTLAENSHSSTHAHNVAIFYLERALRKRMQENYHF